jgi:hypothetical protein
MNWRTIQRMSALPSGAPALLALLLMHSPITLKGLQDEAIKCELGDADRAIDSVLYDLGALINVGVVATDENARLSVNPSSLDAVRVYLRVLQGSLFTRLYSDRFRGDLRCFIKNGYVLQTADRVFTSPDEEAS